MGFLMTNSFVDYNDSETKLNDSLALRMTVTKRTVAFTLISVYVYSKMLKLNASQFICMCDLQNYGERLPRTERLNDIVSNVITSFVCFNDTHISPQILLCSRNISSHFQLLEFLVSGSTPLCEAERNVCAKYFRIIKLC